MERLSSGDVLVLDRGYFSYLILVKAIEKGSRKANCWDNSVAESFFGSLKQEHVYWKCYQTRLEAQQDVLNYIVMFYNSYRLHSYLGYQSPNQFEKMGINLLNVA